MFNNLNGISSRLISLKIVKKQNTTTEKRYSTPNQSWSPFCWACVYSFW